MSVEWLSEGTRPEASHPIPRKDWDEIAALLRTRPGDWACVARDIPRSHASAITSGLKKAFRPPEHYEVETHSDPKKPGQRARHRADLYMRYVGGRGRETRW